MNALLVLKDAEKSSVDFVKLCNLDQLKGLQVPTINDGRQNFFEIRDEIFNKLTAAVQESFKDVSIIGSYL